MFRRVRSVPRWTAPRRRGRHAASPCHRTHASPSSRARCRRSVPTEFCRHRRALSLLRRFSRFSWPSRLLARSVQLGFWTAAALHRPLYAWQSLEPWLAHTVRTLRCSGSGSGRTSQYAVGGSFSLLAVVVRCLASLLVHPVAAPGVSLACSGALRGGVFAGTVGTWKVVHWQ